MAMQCTVCKEGCHELSAAEVNDRLEKFCQLIEVVGLDLLAGLMRLKEESKRKRVLEDLAAEGDEAADRKRLERYGERMAGPAAMQGEMKGGELDTGESEKGDGMGAAGAADGNADTPSTKFRVIREGEAAEYGGRTYSFGGVKRWSNIARLVQANGAFVACDRQLKKFFSKDKEAKAFYEAAVEAEGRGRKGTGRYRLKL